MKKTVSLILVLVLVVSAFCVNVCADSIFSDVPENHWAYSEIQYFYDSVVIDGVGNGMFAPNDNVTREQFAKMISRIYGKTYYGYNADVQTFSDVTPDRWSYDYIESVKEYLTGYYPDGAKPFFNPEGIATREDVAYALVKIGGLDKEFSSDDSVLDNYKDSHEISYNLRQYVSSAIQSGLLRGYEDNTIRPQEGITRAETAALLFRAIKRPVTEDKVVEEPENEVKEEIKEEKEEVKEAEKEETKGIKITNIERISGYRNIKGTINVEMGDDPFFKANMKCYEGLGLVVKCKIDLIEATNSTNTEINGIFKVMYDDVVKHQAIEGTVTLKNGKLTFDAESDNYNLVAYTDDYVEKEEPKKEEVKKEEKPQKEVKDKYVYYDVKEFNGNDAEGTLMLHYKDNEKFVEIADFNVIVGNDIYTYDIIDVSKNSAGGISVKYNLKCNNKVLEEKKISKFEDYAKGLGEYATLDKVSMLIVETEG